MTERNPLRDAELVGLLRHQPELLAIADAIVATDAPRRRRVHARGATWIAAAAAAAAVLLLASPWQQGPSLVDKALAAVGDADVLHVVIEYPPRSQEQLVDIASGRTIAREQRSEIWFDGGRDLKRTVTTLDGRTIDETLETTQGGWTQSGPIYTCAWIAAHPLEATKVRVSCNENMENGTTPHKIPEQRPTLDNALAGFVDGYRSALASGRAEKIGSGEIDGRPVVWLRITFPESTPSSILAGSEEVAIDADTLKPVEVRGPTGSISFRVRVAETVPYDATTFRRPTPVESQSGGNIGPGTPIAPTEAAALLGQPPLWLGEEWNGYRLVAIEHDQPKLRFWLDGRERVESADAVSLTYEPVAGGRPLKIYEAGRCIVNMGMACEPGEVGDGQLLLRPPGVSPLRIGGLWLSVWNFADRHGLDTLELARTLRPYG